MSSLKKTSTVFLIAVISLLATSCIGAINKDFGSCGFDNPIKFSKDGGTRLLEGDGSYHVNITHVNIGGAFGGENYYPYEADGENPSAEQIDADWLTVEYDCGDTYIKLTTEENLSGEPRVANIQLIKFGGYGSICVMQD